ncbi:MAG: helix-hairpin-helix domain-containing protein, partial [Sphingobacteriales bacterium]
RLGVKDKTIQTIKNYLSKGGHFYKPDDLYKIYGMKQEDVTRMLPYVTISNSLNLSLNSMEAKPVYENRKPAEEKFVARVIEINSADSSAFISLPGIGSKLSQRIINFRDKLGGFYAVQQVGETFGLPDSTFQKIKNNLTCNNLSLKKININIADINTLKAHPYIKYSLANVIIQFRNEHGNYSSLEELKKISFVTDDLFKKIAPYLTTE